MDIDYRHASVFFNVTNTSAWLPEPVRWGQIGATAHARHPNDAVWWLPDIDVSDVAIPVSPWLSPRARVLTACLPLHSQPRLACNPCVTCDSRAVLGWMDARACWCCLPAQARGGWVSRVVPVLQGMHAAQACSCHLVRPVIWASVELQVKQMLCPCQASAAAADQPYTHPLVAMATNSAVTLDCKELAALRAVAYNRPTWQVEGIAPIVDHLRHMPSSEKQRRLTLMVEYRHRMTFQVWHPKICPGC